MRTITERVKQYPTTAEVDARRIKPDDDGWFECPCCHEWQNVHDAQLIDTGKCTECRIKMSKFGYSCSEWEVFTEEE